jgi:Fe2+ transport system protein FeoA
MSLTEAPEGVELKVLKINAGLEAKMRLCSMGIQLDNTLVKINKTNWGPVLVKCFDNSPNKLAIGRNIAEKIEVIYEN